MGGPSLRPNPPEPDRSLELDLAVTINAGLPADLLHSAGRLTDPPGAEALWHAVLQGWLEQLIAELPADRQANAYSLGLSLVGDAEIAELNRNWRGQAAATDVLAFAALDEDREGTPPSLLVETEALELGDIVISLETAARQAPDHANSLEKELLFLASHGLLHLLGWDHPDDASLGAMLNRQEQLLISC